MALRITQRRSTNGAQANQIRTLHSLGLKRIRQTVVVPDRPEIRGMAHKVTHLITVEEVSDDLLPNGGKSKYRDRGQGPITSQKVTLSDADAVDPDGTVDEDALADSADEEE